MGRINTYSLSDHTLHITFPAEVAAQLAGYLTNNELIIGGAGEDNFGSFTGEIRVTRNNDMWSTQGDPTGSWVHSKNLDRTGQVSVNIRQVSDDVTKFMYICQIYENDRTALRGMTIEVFKGDKSVATADDCMITKIADQIFGNEAGEQSWVWTAGRVTFNTDRT